MCIDIVEIWFGIANGLILSKLSACDTIMTGYYSLMLLCTVEVEACHSTSDRSRTSGSCYTVP